MTLPPVDHLVWAAPELETASAAIAARLGVEPAAGGVHPAWGTRNRLVSLGPDVYLEIIGPDPEAGASPLLFGIAGLETAGLVTWAAKCPDPETARARAARAGVELGPVLEGGRRTPDGTELRWRLTDPLVVAADGIVPFLIDWGDTPHPAGAAPVAGRLVALAAEHPAPGTVRRALAALGLDGLEVRAGPVPRLSASVETPHGVVTLG